MEATVAARSEADEVIRPVQIPPPVEGGTVIVEDLGRWVAWLTGGLRRERRIAREAANLYGESPISEPEPVEVPAPVPGGTEPITKGGDPPAETR